MAGQAQPPRIIEPFAKNAPDSSPSSPTPGGKTNPFPSASQVGIIDGAASLDDGFPVLTMTDPASGGVPPFGVDMNGFGFLVSSWAAYFAAGQVPLYDATLQTAMGGYAKGSVLAQAANPTEFWISLTNGNMTDPDTGGAGWISSVPLHASSVLSGTVHDLVLPGPSDYFLDFDTTAAPLILDSIVAQRDGQRLTMTPTGANQATFGGSGGTAANRIRQSAAPTFLTNDPFTIQYCAAVSRWVPV